MALPFWNKRSQTTKANRYPNQIWRLPRSSNILTIIQTYYNNNNQGVMQTTLSK